MVAWIRAAAMRDILEHWALAQTRNPKVWKLKLFSFNVGGSLECGELGGIEEYWCIFNTTTLWIPGTCPSLQPTIHGGLRVEAHASDGPPATGDTTVGCKTKSRTSVYRPRPLLHPIAKSHLRG